MELELADVAFDANVWDVKRAIGEVLHGEEFFNPSDPKDRPVNFKVTLNPGRHGINNNGSGLLVLPSRKIGDKFLRWLHGQGNTVHIKDHKLRFFKSRNKPAYGIAHVLDKTPYLPPEIEEEREDVLRKLNVGIYVSKVQFGVFYRRKGSPDNASRAFSEEFELSHENKSAGSLSFEYDHKLIRITLGNTMTEEIAHNIAINFSNIRRMAIGFDFGHPFVCFDIIVPPMLEKQRFNRELTGKDWVDGRKFRQRLDSINATHAGVAPYCHQMRVILHDERDMKEFATLCTIAGLQRPIFAKIDSSKEGFYTPKKLYSVRMWLQGFDWPLAFQIEALLRNGLLNTEDILSRLYEPINKLYRQRCDVAPDVLRNFTEALRSRDPRESPVECFERILASSTDLSPIPLPKGMFSCHHITFTPTRIVLEGPYVIQSNRVIRLYADHQEHFVRVDFRDEDRLQYRWAREVDGTSLLRDRVGGVLKNGFELGGRHFEFLAYSQSALREHAVWFMNPFQHPTEGWVTSQKIRDGLGDFKEIIKAPSKYAARIAQAFTATDPSVKISRDQWKVMPDIGPKSYEFTDGVGTISPQLGDMIWDALCADRSESQRRTIKPSAYQIRFLGFKGMVVIDELLEGVKMCLRPSMKKFESDEKSAMIEIAQAFDRPRPSFLNRPLVMIMEDRGVEKSAFVDLLEKAKAEVYTASDSLTRCIALLKAQSLGPGYRLSFILQCLKAIGMGLEHEKDVQVLDDPFIERLIHYAKNHVLRGMKHAARVPLPESYLLVGVADEGPAYEADGRENVFKLGEGEIFACIQGPDDPEPNYLKGPVMITRSPVVHPGDIQRVRAIGAPPPDQLCSFRNLRNVVVLPSVGVRSLASCLGGGDLDGDEYTLIKYGPLLVTEQIEPASYQSAGTSELDRDSTIEDICDFIVEYINSDVLGLLSTRHLIIADQSKNGTMDKSCLELAQLCSQAVDYPKNGKAVDIHDSPRFLIPYKPDWHQAEVADPRSTDYYESTRALGEMYRRITITPPSVAPTGENAASDGHRPRPLSDSISKALKPYIERQLHRFHNEDKDVADIFDLFHKYRDELRYICMTHALSDAPEVRLTEEEIVVGTILAKCSQHRWRQDRTYRMRLHSSMLARDVRAKLFKQTSTEVPTTGELVYGLSQAWLAWDFSVRNKSLFAANSFGLIALSVICNILEQLPDGLPAQGPAGGNDALGGLRNVAFDADYYAEY
ncbi:RdRP-domain-containing protein [Sparassis latifolia]